jgi:alkyl sulfatase BDS1-like metallo-beta-lactamase superfamily hydrolase
VRFDTMKEADSGLLINWRFTDLGEDYALPLRNSVLTIAGGHLMRRPTLG